ncbi:MAG TPA: amidase family protein, partial [Opitutaceae bacterium]
SRMLSWFDNYDVIVCPVQAGPAAKLDLTADPGARPAGGGGGYTSIYNLTGWPSVVVRAGSSPEGLPIGVQIVAKPWRDDVALAVARFVETKTGGWKAPVI